MNLFNVLESEIYKMKNIQSEIIQIGFNNIDTSEMNMTFELEENVAETRGD